MQASSNGEDRAPIGQGPPRMETDHASDRLLPIAQQGGGESSGRASRPLLQEALPTRREPELPTGLASLGLALGRALPLRNGDDRDGRRARGLAARGGIRGAVAPGRRGWDRRWRRVVAPRWYRVGADGNHR